MTFLLVGRSGAHISPMARSAAAQSPTLFELSATPERTTQSGLE